MNIKEPRQASLPALSEERIADLEDALFADIAADREKDVARSRRRGRLWMAGGAAAAVIAVAAIIAPSVSPLVTGGATDESALAPMPNAVSDSAEMADPSGQELATRDAGAPVTEAGAVDATGAGRDIITTASATVSVGSVETAARTVGDAAAAHGGYVESMSIGTNGQVYPADPADGVVYDTSYPYTPDGAWVTVRVPADELPALVDELAGVGEVTSSSLDRQDVTTQTVDLQARIDAAQASVDRLAELMGQAQNITDLIAAEAALAERQAVLESYQQQLEILDDQVAMSTLTVTLTPQTEQVTADPAGFGDGLAAGWNGLVATLNGIVVALGFLLPWLAVATVAALVVWAVVRIARRRRTRGTDAAASVPEETH